MNSPKIIIEDEAAIRKELEWLVSKKQEFNLVGSGKDCQVKTQLGLKWISNCPMAMPLKY